MACTNKENKNPQGSQPRYGVAQKECGGTMCCASKVNALQLGPKRRRCDIAFPQDQWKLSSSSSTTDPLVHHGRHFGRTVYAFVNVYALIINGLAAEAEDDEDAPDDPQ
jgi:hypothetical protein